MIYVAFLVLELFYNYLKIFEYSLMYWNQINFVKEFLTSEKLYFIFYPNFFDKYSPKEIFYLKDSWGDGKEEKTL